MAGPELFVVTEFDCIFKTLFLWNEKNFIFLCEKNIKTISFDVEVNATGVQQLQRRQLQDRVARSQKNKKAKFGREQLQKRLNSQIVKKVK
jgi:hypothetical protein